MTKNRPSSAPKNNVETKKQNNKAKEQAREKVKNNTKRHIEKLPGANSAKVVANTKNRVNGLLESNETNNKDLHNFATMIMAEAMGEGQRGQAAVGYAILNRVKFWKKSMNSVLFQSGQFSPVTDGRFNKVKKSIKNSDLEFAKKLMKGSIQNPIGKSTFFQTRAAESQSGNWQKTASTLTRPITVGNHVFRTEKKYA